MKITLKFFSCCCLALPVKGAALAVPVFGGGFLISDNDNNDDNDDGKTIIITIPLDFCKALINSSSDSTVNLSTFFSTIKIVIIIISIIKKNQ